MSFNAYILAYQLKMIFNATKTIVTLLKYYYVFD